MGSWFSNPSMRPAIEGGRTGVGKYLSSFRKVDTANVNLESIEVSEHKRQKVVPRSGTELKNFSSW